MTTLRDFVGVGPWRLRYLWLSVGCLLLATHSFTAQAQSLEPESQEVARARDYFRAGAQAYSIGEYAAAVQAFEQAYQLAPRPAVLFSIAQAEKRQYSIAREPSHLSKAIDLYRQYLREEPQATRKADAVQALSELEPLLSSAVPETETATSLPTAPSPRETAAPTRLMLSSPIAGARIALDDAEPQRSPLIREVEPGEHRAQISAPGYVTDERRIVAVEGALVTFDISLTERPAKLKVFAPDGAVLSIDGRVQGTCPFPKPLELPSGDHLITFTDSGYVAWSEERRLPRGETTIVIARMPRTFQRTTALMLFGAAASAVTASGILTYFTLGQEGSAQSFLEERGNQPLTTEELDTYNSVRRDRDNLRIATLTTAGIGLGLATLGAFLFAYDSQSAPQQPPKKTAKRDFLSARSSREFQGLKVTVWPELSPEFTSLSLSGRF